MGPFYQENLYNKKSPFRAEWRFYFKINCKADFYILQSLKGLHQAYPYCLILIKRHDYRR